MSVKSTVINALKIQSVVGRVTGTSELRRVKVGKEMRSVLNVILAINEHVGGEDVVSFLKVAFWGKQAEAVSEWLYVGHQILVENARVFVEPYLTKAGDPSFALVAKSATLTALFTPFGDDPTLVCEISETADATPEFSAEVLAAAAALVAAQQSEAPKAAKGTNMTAKQIAELAINDAF